MATVIDSRAYAARGSVWTRDGARAFRMGRAIKAGRVWTNCYHHYPAGAAFGGYKASGVGRENHRIMLDHYSHMKCLLVSYDSSPMGRAGPEGRGGFGERDRDLLLGPWPRAHGCAGGSPVSHALQRIGADSEHRVLRGDPLELGQRRPAIDGDVGTDLRCQRRPAPCAAEP